MKTTIQLLLYIMLCFTSRSWATNKPFPIAYFRGQSQNFPIDYLFDKKEIKWVQDIRQIIHCHQIDFKLPLKKTQKHHCYLCNKSYKSIWSLKEHNKIHNGQGFPCSFCAKVFTRQSYQADHERIHTGTKPFLCTDCHKSFRCKRNLVQHKKIHLSKTQKSLSCPHCSKKYRYNGYLTNHLATCKKASHQ